MSDQVDPQAIQQAAVQQDPQYELEEHITFKRRQEAQNLLFRNLIVQNLSDFTLTMDGTAYAYTRVSLRNKGIKQITEAIELYPHLRNADFGFNQLKDINYLEKLKFFVELNLQNNLITDLKFLQIPQNFPNLKKLNIQGNKILSLDPISLKNLRHLNLNSNAIISLAGFEGHEKLQVLEMRKNKLTDLKGLADLPNLKELYLAENQLTDFNGLANVPKLIKIHARKNKIQGLTEFPDTPTLDYLNLRENQIKTVESLKGIPKSISILNVLGCPLSEQMGDNTKKQIWMRFRNYEKINKTEVNAEEKQEFDKEYKDRLAQQERERLEKQAAQREARQAEKQA